MVRLTISKVLPMMLVFHLLRGKSYQKLGTDVVGTRDTFARLLRAPRSTTLCSTSLHTLFVLLRYRSAAHCLLLQLRIISALGN